MFELISVRKFLDRLKGSANGAVLARGAIGAFIVKIVGAGLLFGLHILLARLLGVSQYGIYIYAITWISILTILSLIGFQTSLVRFIAEYKAKQQWGLLKGIIRRSTETVLAFSIFAGIIVGAITLSLKERLSDELAVVFYVVSALLPVFALCRLREASLRALKCIVQSELLLRVIRPMLLAVFVGLLFFLLHGSLKATDVIIGNFIALVLVFLTGTFLLHRALPVSVHRSTSEYSQRQWLKVSLPLLLIAGMNIILKQTDIIMIGAIRSSADAGIYSVASRISDLVVFGLMAINSILAPMISELYHTGRKQELQRIVTLAARGIFAFTFSVSILLAVFGKFALSLFGTEFVASYIPLLILLSGRIICALAGSVGLLMIMTVHQNLAGAIIGISAVINIALNIFLIPLFGLVGAAISTALTVSLRNIVLLVIVQQKLRVNPTIIAQSSPSEKS